MWVAAEATELSVLWADVHEREDPHAQRAGQLSWLRMLGNQDTYLMDLVMAATVRLSQVADHLHRSDPQQQQAVVMASSLMLTMQHTLDPSPPAAVGQMLHQHPAAALHQLLRYQPQMLKEIKCHREYIYKSNSRFINQ